MNTNKETQIALDQAALKFKIAMAQYKKNENVQITRIPAGLRTRHVNAIPARVKCAR